MMKKKIQRKKVVNDLIEIIIVFSSKIYGLRSYKKDIIVNKKKLISDKNYK